MNKGDLSKSDNSIDKSVARSSSGVSTQVSADGVFMDKDVECQILYGNLYSRFPHPVFTGDRSSRQQKSFSSQTKSSITNYDESLNDDNCHSIDINSTINTVDRGSLSTDGKSRRHSEAHLRSFGKRKQNTEKRRSISNNFPDSSNTLEKLLSTLNDIQECHSPNYYNDSEGHFFRNPQVPNPSGEIQDCIFSKIPYDELQSSDLLETLMRRAESNPKELFFSTLDGNGKVVSNSTLTYSKLYQRAKRISYFITSKRNNSEQELNVRPGQSVGLVFSSEDAVDFVIGFYACLLAKVIAIPVEKPSLTQLSTSSLTGKYLNQLGVNVILTNTNCYKEITRKGGDIKELPQWKELVWVPIDTYYSEKLSKNYLLPESCTTYEVPLYVEYAYLDEHSLRGVPVSHESTLKHCEALVTMCHYQEGQTILCTDDVRHQAGLWHCVLTAVYCGMNTVFVPFTLVKKNPLCWLNAITKQKIKFVVTNSRVLHNSLLGLDKKDLNNIDLSHVETLLVSDACVPWINETLDRFIKRFQAVGLQNNVMLPCVGKSETLTICMRRRNDTDRTASSIMKLCLESLSYDLIRETPLDSSPMIVSLESSGSLLPTMQAVVIRLDGSRQMCRRDEIGEICVSSPFSNRVFWMTPDEISAQYLQVTVDVPNDETGDTAPVKYTRTGLVGFFRNINGTDNIYIHGFLRNYIEVNGRRFNSEDLNSTVAVVKPSGVLYKARCCVFTVPVLEHNRLVIAIEINNEKFSDDKIYDWISSVLQAVLNLHQVNVYCVVGLSPNTFHKTLLGDINANETMNRFLRGTLNITHLTLCPQTAISNLPGLNRSGAHNHGFSPASILAHAMNAQTFARVSGLSTPPRTKTSNLLEILEWRATHTPDRPLFSVINSKFAVVEKITCEMLHRKAERLASLLKDKIKTPLPGSVVAIYLNNPLELTYAIYACYYIGMVPLVLKTPGSESSWLPFNLTENIWACKQTKAVAFLTANQTIRLLKSKEYNNFVPADLWPHLIDISETPKKKPLSGYTITSPEKQLALIRLNIDRVGLVTLPAWTHSNIVALCETHKIQNDLVPDSEVALCLDINTNIGIFLHCISPVYCGHHSFIILPATMSSNPDTWLSYLCKKTIKHTFCSEEALSQSSYIARFDETLFTKKPCLNLQHVESLIVCVSDRPNFVVIKEFLAVFEDSKFGLQTISIGIDSPWTLGLFIQIPKSSYPRTVYLEKLALRNYKIAESQETNDSSLEILELGQPVPNSLVIIVDYQSQCQKSINQLGELWLSSEYTCQSILASATQKHLELLYRDVLNVGRHVCDNDTCDVLSDNILCAKLAFGENTQSTFVRTGLLGFLRSFGPENQLFVLGRVDDAILMRGFTYFSTELEECICQVDPDSINQSFVFTESELLVAVIELRDNCKPELCYRLLPKLVKSVVENFLLPLGVIQFIKYGRLSFSWNENRRKIKSLWLHKKLESILQFYCL